MLFVILTMSQSATRLSSLIKIGFYKYQQEILKIRGFPSPDYSGFGFNDLKLDQGI